MLPAGPAACPARRARIAEAACPMIPVPGRHHFRARPRSGDHEMTTPLDGRRFAPRFQAPLALLALILVVVAAPSVALAITVSGDFLFTENRGANPFIGSGHRFVIGATSVVPSGGSTTVTAIR